MLEAAAGVKEPSDSNSASAKEDDGERLGFKFVWPVKVNTRQLNPNDPTSFTILHVSPKFVTAHDHVSFQWTLKLCATDNVSDESEDDDRHDCCTTNKEKAENDYVCSDMMSQSVQPSRTYPDWEFRPTATVELKAKVKVMVVANPPSSDSHHVYPGAESRLLIDDGKRLSVLATRGRECEIAFKDQGRFSDYINQHIGCLVRLSFFLEMDASMFCTDSYLNAASPTPIHSFLVQNYNARTSSKVWEATRSCSSSRPRSASDGQPGCGVGGKGRVDLERLFGKVMDAERERRDLLQLQADTVGLELIRTESTDRQSVVDDSPSTTSATNHVRTTHVERPKAALIPQFSLPAEQHLFKKLLIACCDSCERRASIAPGSDLSETLRGGNGLTSPCERGGGSRLGRKETAPADEMESESEEDCAFECPEEKKREMHDALANMYFNRVALPEMEFVEDFSDFLIGAELNDLPVLKRACERYLCSELNTRRELATPLLLEFFFLSMVFQLPVLKSMTLVELCGRHDEIGDADAMMEHEEYKNLDKRIRQLCDRNLSDLLEECKRFREQRNRVHVFNVS